MEEASRVLDRLRRIEVLEREDAPPAALLAEVRELLVEAEAWVRSEGRTDRRAEVAVHRLGKALEAAPDQGMEPERSLVA
jgi:hypothetical protein